jgi:aminopeptidase N/Tfp pilus assembly protein PilF
MTRALLASSTLAALCWLAAPAQQRRAAIDVESYRIELFLEPAQQALSEKAVVTFSPAEDRVQRVAFELHGALNVVAATAADGQELQTSRRVAEHALEVFFPQPLERGKPVTVTFRISGRLAGDEESPVYGITFAAIRPDHAFLLYPARWFPVSGYTTDRYQMDLTVRAPAGFRVISSGVALPEADGQAVTFRSTTPGFYGSLALAQGAPQRVESEGAVSEIWFRGERQANARAWGEETGRVMAWLTSVFGVPPYRNLALVETGEGAPNGYAAPGILFVSPAAAGGKPNVRLLANQIARQWYGVLFSPAHRNHIWITNGMARYAEILYLEHLNGAQAVEPEIRDLYIDALTVTDAPVRQAARFEDYSPEFFAVTGSKGAAVYHMLRWVIGEEAFAKFLKAATDQFANRSITTDDVRKLAETVSGENLQGFFIQWLESTDAPEFRMKYTIYRTQKGFRVMGTIQQDLDTFRMPVELRIETEGNPEYQRVTVVGPSTDFSVDTFGKPRKVIIDPNGRVLRFSREMRVAVAIRRGEQFAEIGQYNDALKEYQKALEVNPISSLAHYRIGEVFFLMGNYQSAANSFREALNGDQEPSWTVVWSHINLGKIFDVTQQRERARNEYQQALRTKDNTQGALEEAAKYLQEPYQRKEN